MRMLACLLFGLVYVIRILYTFHFWFGYFVSRRAEMSKSIVKGIGIGFLSCIGIGIGIAKTIS